MIELTVADSLREKLVEGKELVAVRDSQGKTLGFFAPVTEEYARRLEAFLSQYDADEIKRRRESPGPHLTTVEVFEHLLTLTEDEESREDLRRHIESLRERDRCATR